MSNYYDKGGISVLDYWKAKLDNVQLEGLFLGNALKYLSRAGQKANNSKLQDYKKARDYINWLIELEETKNEK